MIRLSKFIRRDMEQILKNWEAFAVTCLPAAASMGPLELRDHARQMLETIAADLETTQSAEHLNTKSLGLAVTPCPAPKPAAQIHAVVRAKQGFNIKQLIAEYRALRASVLALWVEACLPDNPQLQDVFRFNEAIDQAVAESVEHFSAQVTRARNLLLGTIGHDMRSPLQAVQMVARQLQRRHAEKDISTAAERLIRSGSQLQALLNDLVDFNRMNLGIGMSILPVLTDLSDLCNEEVEQIKAAYPDSTLELLTNGDCRGSWDGKRMRQLLGNLVTNAIHHGAPEQPVRIMVVGDKDVCIKITNQGPTIDQAALSQIFEPLVRSGSTSATGHSGMGLGLYIVREIANGHGGTVEARSGGGETVFTVLLPKGESNL